MRVTQEQSTDLGFVLTALITAAVTRAEVEDWASRVINCMSDPPLYIYSMLDLTRAGGRALREEIGFVPTSGIENDDEFQYLREVGAARGTEDPSYLAGKPKVALPPERRAYIDNMLQRNFGINPRSLNAL